jgi:hypothetical protein
MKQTYQEIAHDFVKNFNAKASRSDYPYIITLDIGKFGKKELDLFTNESDYKKLISKGQKTTTKTFRTLRVYAANTDSNFRSIIFELHHVASNPAEFLKDAWKEQLYKEFLYQGMQLHILTNVREYAQEPQEPVEDVKPIGPEENPSISSPLRKV